MYVIEGKIILIFENESVELSAGDSISINSDIQHGFMSNVFSKAITISWEIKR